jgi:uncharacterized membrane protein YqaE (UPF0057 family)
MQFWRLGFIFWACYLQQGLVILFTCLIGSGCYWCDGLQVIREFKVPDGVNREDIDASTDGSVPSVDAISFSKGIATCWSQDTHIVVWFISGDVLVVLDLRPDESLLEAGFAREVRLRWNMLSPCHSLSGMSWAVQNLKDNCGFPLFSKWSLSRKARAVPDNFFSHCQIVNRVQKLRKKAGLEPTDTVEVYYNVLGDVAGGDASVLQQVFTLQVWPHFCWHGFEGHAHLLKLILLRKMIFCPGLIQAMWVVYKAGALREDSTMDDIGRRTISGFSVLHVSCAVDSHYCTKELMSSWGLNL